MNILIVEDEAKVAQSLKNGLEEQDHQVVIAYDGQIGLRLTKFNSYDLILLDAIVPGINGFDLCREIKKDQPGVKIIMLTALGNTDDKVDGLEAGADDYMVKPFDFRELLARIRTVTQRHNVQNASRIKIGDLILDTGKKLAYRGQKQIDLTAKEYTLLEYLMVNKNKVLSRQSITSNVWELDFDPGTNVVDVYVNILRKKVDRDFDQKLIHTRVGMGYYISDQQ